MKKLEKKEKQIKFAKSINNRNAALKKEKMLEKFVPIFFIVAFFMSVFITSYCCVIQYYYFACLQYMINIFLLCILSRIYQDAFSIFDYFTFGIIQPKEV